MTSDLASLMGLNHAAMALVEIKGLVDLAAKFEIQTSAVVPG